MEVAAAMKITRRMLDDAVGEGIISADQAQRLHDYLQGLPGAGPVFNFTNVLFYLGGLIAILRALFSGQPLEHIPRIDAQAQLGRLGLEQHLSSQRSNGLKAMVRRLNDLARAASPA